MPDILIASRDDATSRVVWVVSGRDGSLLHTLGCKHHGDTFGCAMASAGDFDRDGAADFLVACGRDHVRLFSGKSASAVLTIEDKESAPGFGSSVASGADVDGDGVFDVLVGSPYTSGGAGSASATLFSGKTGSVLRHLEGGQGRSFRDGSTWGDRFGTSVSFCPDLDRDGIPDLLIGAPEREDDDVTLPSSEAILRGERGKKLVSGRLEVFSGKSGKRIHSIAGDRDADGFGWAVGTAGDVDKDGIADFYGIAIHRYLRVYSGSSGKPLYTLPSRNGYAVMDAFGSSADCVPDIDGDGVPELVVGADEAMEGFFDVGYAVLCSGKDGKRTDTLFESLEEGVDVCVLGDVDRDSLPDLGLVIHGRWKSDKYVLRILSGKDRETIREVDLRSFRATPVRPGSTMPR